MGKVTMPKGGWGRAGEGYCGYGWERERQGQTPSLRTVSYKANWDIGFNFPQKHYVLNGRRPTLGLEDGRKKCGY
jgi:hypothetical protein